MAFTGMEFTMEGLDSFFAPLRFAESLTRRTQLDSSQAVSRGVSGGPGAIWAFERGEGGGVHTSDEDRGPRRAPLTPHPLGSGIGSLSLCENPVASSPAQLQTGSYQQGLGQSPNPMSGYSACWPGRCPIALHAVNCRPLIGRFGCIISARAGSHPDLEAQPIPNLDLHGKRPERATNSQSVAGFPIRARFRCWLVRPCRNTLPSDGTQGLNCQPYAPRWVGDQCRPVHQQKRRHVLYFICTAM